MMRAMAQDGMCMCIGTDHEFRKVPAWPHRLMSERVMTLVTSGFTQCAKHQWSVRKHKHALNAAAMAAKKNAPGHASGRTYRQTSQLLGSVPPFDAAAPYRNTCMIE